MVPNNIESYESLIRLIRVARGLEAGGYYNAAKLFWALTYSQEVRGSNKVNIPTEPEELDSEIASAIEEFVSKGASPTLLAALQHGREAVRANSAIPASEIPPVFVCRSCGEIILGDAPDQCPGCGAWELTFREFPPIYYLEPLHPKVLLKALEATPQKVEQTISDLDEDQMAKRPRIDEWSIREVLFHLLVTQELLAGRVERMLAEENPTLEGVAAWATESPALLTTSAMLDKYRGSRQETINLLKQMPVESWWRTAQHEEFGSVTILQQASYFAKHERSHLPQMASIRRTLTG